MPNHPSLLTVRLLCSRYLAYCRDALGRPLWHSGACTMSGPLLSSLCDEPPQVKRVVISALVCELPRHFMRAPGRLSLARRKVAWVACRGGLLLVLLGWVIACRILAEVAGPRAEVLRLRRRPLRYTGRNEQLRVLQGKTPVLKCFASNGQTTARDPRARTCLLAYLSGFFAGRRVVASAVLWRLLS